MPQQPIRREFQSVPQIRARVGELIDELNKIIRIEGKGGIKITSSDTNLIISLEGRDLGGGVLSGFEERNVFIVEDDDTVTQGDILFRPND